MGIFLDLILVIILLLNIFLGYKKGLINVVFSICAFLVALIITLILYKPISNIIIDNTEIDNKIREIIINNNSGDSKEENASDKTTNTLQKYIEEKMTEATEEAKTTAIEILAESISIKIVEFITAILLFIITRVILILLKFLTETIASLPIIKQFNEAGGAVYGLIKGIIIIYLILTILFVVVSINGNGRIARAIDDSIVTKQLYNHNIITKSIAF